MNSIQSLKHREVSIWLDTLSRELIEDGGLSALMRELGVSGATSNPTIFANAIRASLAYDPQLGKALDSGVASPHELFLELALEDVRRAAEMMRPIHEASMGDDGFVSLEVTPDIAYDAEATVAQALELWRRLDAPNVLIKVPATAPGIEAIEELAARGVNVNVTLLFALDRYERAIEAYFRGLERRAATGRSLAGITSVASFFVSRVDARADARLPAHSPLRGKVGIANARAAYGRYRQRFAGARWERLAALGAAPQKPLWASTATKDARYRDVLYLEQLALPGTILTVPEPTLRAFADHGDLTRAEPFDLAESEEVAAAATDLPAITRTLEREGVDAFRSSYDELLAGIEERRHALQGLLMAA